MKIISRNLYIDFLKGIAILFVIMVHTFVGLNVAGVFSISLRILSNVAVPMFLSISGFCLSTKIFKTKSDIFYFYKRQIPKVYIPCLIWSIPFLAYHLYLHNSVKYELFNFFTCGESVYYFIAIIIQFYLLLPILLRWNGKIFLIISFVISSFSIILQNVIFSKVEVSGPYTLLLGYFPIWLFFFEFGLYLKRIQRNYSYIITIIIILIGIICTYIEFHYFHNYEYNIGSFILATGVILFMYKKTVEFSFNKYLVQVIFSKYIEYVGKTSLFIYLVHIHIKVWLPSLGHIVNVSNITWAVDFLMVTSLTMVVLFICKKCFPVPIQRLLGIY
jgi:fucose 4-O-acetylase-like acetyltransferase